MTKTEEMESIPPFAWYEDFYRNIVLPRVAKGLKMTEPCAVLLTFSTCTDGMDTAPDIGPEADTNFMSWLAENDPALYNRIEEADVELNSLWLSRAEQKSFKDACTTWYNLLIEAKKGFDAWKKKQREEALAAGRQEALPMR